MNTSYKTLLQLNDDCLLEIFQYLSPPEVLSLMSSHPRFEELGCRRVANWTHLNTSYLALTQYTSSVLEIIGRKLISLHIEAGDTLTSDCFLHQYIELLCSQASKLEIVNIQDIQLCERCVKTLRKIAPNLKHLSLNNCQLTDNLLEPILENCKDLKSLTLIDNYCISHTSLCFLNGKNLKESQINKSRYCMSHIRALIAANPNVTFMVYLEDELIIEIFRS